MAKCHTQEGVNTMKGILELECEDIQPVEEENLMIVDCLNLSFRYKHRGQTDFASDYLRTINSLAKSYGAKTVVLAADWKSSAFRKDVSADYKSNRKALYKDQTPEEKKKFADFFEGYEKSLTLAQKSYPMLRFLNVEADDIATYLVKQVKQKYKHTWLISTDRDWDLLLDENVSRFSYVTRKEYTIGNFYDEHGCDTPEQYISVKVLQGDAGDGVIGVPLVGAKRAYNLIREHGSALDIFTSLPLEGTQKFIANINASDDLILRNYELMDLLSYCEEAIAFPNPDNIAEIQEFCDKL